MLRSATLRATRNHAHRPTRLIAVWLSVTLVAVGCSAGSTDDDAAQWFERLIPDGPATLADVCDEVCTADLVMLPELRVVESVVDLPMPDTAGAISVERVWTGERGELFGAGWETVWDIRLRDATLSGPLPAAPVTEPARGLVELADGTSLEFDAQGRPVSICADAAVCTAADWSDGVLRLSAASVSVELVLDGGRVISATSSDGRTVDYAYDADRLARVRSEAGDVDYSYLAGRLSGINGVESRTFDYEGDTLRASTDRNGERWLFSTIEAGVVQVTEPDGEVLTYTFAERSLRKVVAGDGEVLVERTFDDGRLVREERPAEGITLTRVSANEFEVTQRRELEPTRRAVMEVDQFGRVVRSVSSSGEMLVSYVGRSSRPASTRVGDQVTTFEYDEHGLLTRTVDADGYEVTLERDELGLVRSLSDGVLATSFDYDAVGRPIREESAGRETVAEFGADGLVRSLTLPGGSTKVPVSYAESGTLQSVGASADLSVLSQLEGVLSGSSVVDDSVDEIIEVQTGWEYRYRSGRLARFDDWGRLVELQADGRSTEREYDDAGRLLAVALADVRTFALTYTSAGRIASVSDGTVTADLMWHGDLLTAVTTSTGSSYRYEYDTSGRLLSTEAGPARWEYRYDDAGNLSHVMAPSGVLTYEWDELGRPTQSLISGQMLNYEWEGDGFDLLSVSSPEQSVIGFERDSDGRVIAMDTPDGRATFEYSAGGLVGYRLSGGADVSVAYSSDGSVASVAYGDVTEQWEWRDGALRTVTIKDVRYDLEWLAPGVLASVTRDGTTLMRLEATTPGQVTSVHDADDKVVGAFEWSSTGLRRADIDGWVMEVDYDSELRPVRLSADDATATSTYDAGQLVGMSVGDTSITGTYTDGRLQASRLERGDRWANIAWSEQGQPASFTSSEGDGAFGYTDGRIATITYDDKLRDVTYDDRGRPSADGAAGNLLDDLFGDRGVLTIASGDQLAQPWAPWFDALPGELGVELPTVITGDDVVAAAIEQATPDLPIPVAPTDDIAERTARTIVALAGPSVFPVTADRTVRLPSQPTASDLEALVAAAPTALVGGSVLERLADGPCLLCRVVDAGAGALSTIGRAGAAVAGFLTDSVIGQAVLSVAFFVGSFAVGVLCATAGVCAVALGVAAPVVIALLASGGDDLAGAVSAAVLEPFASLLSGVRDLDPATLLSVALTVAAFRAGASSSPRLAGLRARVVSPVCNTSRVVCLSVRRFGPAAEHVVDAQRNGAPRLLTIDRAGAQARRTSALRSVPAIAGFDRDEYPFAVSSRRAGLSIRHLDPSSNRSLGSYLGRQLSRLPDGARFLVLPID